MEGQQNQAAMHTITTWKAARSVMYVAQSLLVRH